MQTRRSIAIKTPPTLSTRLTKDWRGAAWEVACGTFWMRGWDSPSLFWSCGCCETSTMSIESWTKGVSTQDCNPLIQKSERLRRLRMLSEISLSSLPLRRSPKTTPVRSDVSSSTRNTRSRSHIHQSNGSIGTRIVGRIRRGKYHWLGPAQLNSHARKPAGGFLMTLEVGRAIESHKAESRGG